MVLFRNLIIFAFVTITFLVASTHQTFADSTLEAIENAPRQETIAGHHIQLINQNNEIDTIVDERNLQEDTQDSDAFIYGNYTVQGMPIVLIEYSPQGNFCDAQFSALAFGKKITLSKEFGTCADQPSVSVSGNELIATFPDVNGQGTEVDTISQNGVSSSEVAAQLIGPPYSIGMDLGKMVSGQDILIPFRLRATSDKIQSLVGQSVYKEISTYAVGSNITSVGDYVTDDLCQAHNCNMAMVHLVFDHNGHAWVATSDGQNWTWYGSPPAFVIATLSSQQGFQAPAPVDTAISPQNPLPTSSGIWTAVDANGNFADTGSLGQQKIAMVLPQNSTHFEILLTGFQSNVPDGTSVSFTATFDNGQSISFSGQSSSKEVQVNLNDNEVAFWTHNLTADKMMSITFGGISENPWAIPLSGTTPTVTAMAEAIKLAGVTGLPAPWSVASDLSLAPAAAPTQPVANPPTGNLAFLDPQGIAYANLGETTWSTNKTYDEMTDKMDISVVSNQQNDTGVTAQVIGACSTGIVTFTATIVDGSGKPTIHLANETVAYGIDFVGGKLRINSQPESQNLFVLSQYNNTPQIAQLSIGGSNNALSVTGQLDLTATWRILVELDTDHGPIIIKIPLYDPHIESILQACVAEKAASTGYLGISAKDHPEKDGAVIIAVTPNGPSSTSGLQPGDVITQVNGEAITSVNDLQVDIQSITPGQNAIIDFVRSGRNQEIIVAVGARGENPAQ